MQTAVTDEWICRLAKMEKYERRGEGCGKMGLQKWASKDDEGVDAMKSSIGDQVVAKQG